MEVGNGRDAAFTGNTLSLYFVCSSPAAGVVPILNQLILNGFDC